MLISGRHAQRLVFRTYLYRLGERLTRRKSRLPRARKEDVDFNNRFLRRGLVGILVIHNGVTTYTGDNNKIWRRGHIMHGRPSLEAFDRLKKLKERNVSYRLARHLLRRCFGGSDFRFAVIRLPTLLGRPLQYVCIYSSVIKRKRGTFEQEEQNGYNTRCVLPHVD